MRIDPPVRPDGRCLVCEGERRLAKLKPLYRDAMLTDPFCSTVCARSWWGTELPSTQRATPARQRAARDAAATFRERHPMHQRTIESRP